MALAYPQFETMWADVLATLAVACTVVVPAAAMVFVAAACCNIGTVAVVAVAKAVVDHGTWSQVAMFAGSGSKG